MSEEALLEEFGVDFVVDGCADAGVADVLDLAADADLAARAGDEPGDAADGEWKEGGDAERAEADAHSASCAAMHQVAEQQPGGCAKECRGDHGACFDPLGC